MLTSDLLSIDIRQLSPYLKRADKVCGSGQVDGVPAFRWRCDNKALRFSYSYGGKEYDYEIRVEAHGSNLGIKGEYYYFICPCSGVRCRRLYFYGGFFVGRKALPGIMYPTQERTSEVVKVIRNLFEASELIGGYRKEYYRGKLTPYGRKLGKVTEMIKRLEV